MGSWDAFDLIDSRKDSRNADNLINKSETINQINNNSLDNFGNQSSNVTHNNLNDVAGNPGTLQFSEYTLNDDAGDLKRGDDEAVGDSSGGDNEGVQGAGWVLPEARQDFPHRKKLQTRSKSGCW
jgi:hypothetical protein